MYIAMTWSTFGSRSLLSVQRLKLESAEHAASSIRLPRTSPTAPAAAAVGPTARLLGVETFSRLIEGGKKDAATAT